MDMAGTRTSRDRTGHFVRPDGPFRNWVTRERRIGSERGRRLQGGARPLSSHCLARLPVGAPHAHLPQAQGDRGHDLALGRPLAARRARLDFRPGPGVFPIRSSARLAARILCEGAARLQRPRHRAGAVGPEDEHDRQQRIVRNHPHVQQRLRWGRGGGGRLLSGELQAEIDALNARIYATVNNGVYRAGFATTQAAYEEAFAPCSRRSTGWRRGWRTSRSLCGERLTEATGGCSPR